MSNSVFAAAHLISASFFLKIKKKKRNSLLTSAMLHLQPRGGLFSYSFSTCTCKRNNLLVIIASSKHLIHTSFMSPLTVAPKPVFNSMAPSAHSRLLHTHRHVTLEDGPEAKSWRLNFLNQKLKDIGIDSASCVPGQYSVLHCPKCKGGDNNERSLSLFIDQQGNAALWTCFRGKCGWRGSTRALAYTKSTLGDMKKSMKLNKKYRQLDEQSLGWEPLSNELLAYFSRRMISRKTLRRNGVMQHKIYNQIVIAFPYRRNGELVCCKYRDVNKKFSQESDTEKILYGLDDIKGASDIIIVEGEMDKLAMEEAGFRNCVSVPNGAPASVSKKELPPEDQDTTYEYLWNCKDLFEKASRIILATDGDPPGQALAEELARRLGRERCWRVNWPNRTNGHCKDANEVLVYLGPDELKGVIENAELYIP